MEREADGLERVVFCSPAQRLSGLCALEAELARRCARSEVLVTAAETSGFSLTDTGATRPSARAAAETSSELVEVFNLERADARLDR